MIIRKKLIALITMTLIVCSCDSLLDADVRSSISGQTFWQAEGDFEPYLTGIYARYRGHIDYMGFGEDRSEMWSQGRNARFTPGWSHTMTAGNTMQWTAYYGTIGHINLLLEKIESFDFTNSGEKNRIIAEAHAMRAAMYFFLARVWGDVPLALEPVEDQNAPLLARTPVEEIFLQINSDIEQALNTFPQDGYTSRYRWTRPGVYALLADVKMWSATVLNGGEPDFNAAIEAITQVENSDVFLLNDFRSIFEEDQNNEIIFSFYLDRSEYTSAQYNHALPRVDTAGGADNADELPIALGGQDAYTLSNEALELLNTYPEDKRIEVTYITEIANGEPVYHWPFKLIGTQYPDTRVADSDIILYRLADLFLLKAEAFAAMNQPQNALEYLNKVRDRAGVPAYSETNQTLLQKEILDERGRELFHEIKRWYDLRRAHAMGVIDVYEYVPNLRGQNTPLYWPVHVAMLSRNDKLVQTEGY